MTDGTTSCLSHLPCPRSLSGVLLLLLYLLTQASADHAVLQVHKLWHLVQPGTWSGRGADQGSKQTLDLSVHIHGSRLPLCCWQQHTLHRLSIMVKCTHHHACNQSSGDHRSRCIAACERLITSCPNDHRYIPGTTVEQSDL
jgi:hypothetical protein